MAKFNIIKTDSHKKVRGVWEYGVHDTVIATIEAKNRREAFGIYIQGISSKYSINRRNLTASRKNNSKRRRTEWIKVEKV